MGSTSSGIWLIPIQRKDGDQYYTDSDATDSSDAGGSSLQMLHLNLKPKLYSISLGLHLHIQIPMLPFVDFTFRWSNRHLNERVGNFPVFPESCMGFNPKVWSEGFEPKFLIKFETRFLLFPILLALWEGWNPTLSSIIKSTRLSDLLVHPGFPSSRKVWSEGFEPSWSILRHNACSVQRDSNPSSRSLNRHMEVQHTAITYLSFFEKRPSIYRIAA